MEHYICIKNEKVPVTEVVYKEYCRGERKERYFAEGDIHNQVFSYDALDTGEMNGCEMFADRNARTVEEQVEWQLVWEDLKQAIAHLNRAEQELIRRIYLYDQSLRQIAREKHIPLTTLQCRHKRTLEKLRNLMEKRGEGRPDRRFDKNFKKVSYIDSSGRIKSEAKTSPSKKAYKKRGNQS